MDAFSAALNCVRISGAIFSTVTCAAPWGFLVPEMRRASGVLAPGAERVVGYHLVTEGSAAFRIGDRPVVPVTAGDIVIIPHGNAHTVWNGSPSTWMDSGAFLDNFLAGDLHVSQVGNGGEVTRFVCGYFGCDRHADRLFLAGLPTMIKIDVRGDTAGQWLESSIRHLVSTEEAGRVGRSALLSRMAEALFIEAMRRYVERLPSGQTGWLAAARDPVVGAALALLHRQAAYRWTLPELAAAAGASRSVLAERFALLVGEPPLKYLSRWRLQLASRLLQTTRKSLLQIAVEVGYESETAFIRAFKREFGLPPGRYRRLYEQSKGEADVEDAAAHRSRAERSSQVRQGVAPDRPDGAEAGERPRAPPRPVPAFRARGRH